MCLGQQNKKKTDKYLFALNFCCITVILIRQSYARPPQSGTLWKIEALTTNIDGMISTQGVNFENLSNFLDYQNTLNQPKCRWAEMLNADHPLSILYEVGESLQYLEQQQQQHMSISR
jgi:hypothetical protein